MAIGDRPFHRGIDYPFDPDDFRNQQMTFMPSSTGGPTPVCAVLSVSDVERLAKAGVKVEWENIKGQVRPDPPQRPYLFDCEPLLRPLLERFRTWEEIGRSPDTAPGRFAPDPFHLSAVVHGEKVHVFVAAKGKPPIILEDDVHLYPSDALMAKLHLMGKFHREK